MRTIFMSDGWHRGRRSSSIIRRSLCASRTAFCTVLLHTPARAAIASRGNERAGHHLLAAPRPATDRARRGYFLSTERKENGRQTRRRRSGAPSRPGLLFTTRSLTGLSAPPPLMVNRRGRRPRPESEPGQKEKRYATCALTTTQFSMASGLASLRRKISRPSSAARMTLEARPLDLSDPGGIAGLREAGPREDFRTSKRRRGARSLLPATSTDRLGIRRVQRQ